MINNSKALFLRENPRISIDNWQLIGDSEVFLRLKDALKIPNGFIL